MQRKQILALAFLNGAGIMSFEMISGKMLAPFYGTSLEVWAVTLAVVMSGLAIGYWLGGRQSEKNTETALLGRLLFISAITVALAPVLGKVFFAFSYRQFGISGSFLSSIAIILPYMIVAGMISPILTHIITSDEQGSGQSAGKIFSLSTIGGVLATFLTGFWFIPLLGLEVSVIILATSYVVMGFVLMAGLHFKVGKPTWVTSVLSVLVVSVSAISTSSTLYPGVLYRQTGLYGELMVADIPLKFGKKTYARRMFLSNRVGQTNMNKVNGCSLWSYVHYLSTIAGMHPTGSDVLLLGVAGGSIANELVHLGFKVDAVDLDPRVFKVASTYFRLSPEINSIEDDARHFLNVSKKVYKLIVIDLFAGEGVPNHILTLESLDVIKKRLDANGTLVINFHGFLEGDEGRGARAVYKTLITEGYNTRFMLTRGKPGARNTLFVATMNQDPQFFRRKTYRQTPCSLSWRVNNPPVLIKMRESMYKNDVVLQDEYPVLDRLNKAAYANWRQYTIEHHLLELNEQGLPFF